VQLPDPDHQIPSVSSEVFKQELAAALDRQSNKLDLAAYLEFCAESDIPKVVSLLADRLRQYGDGAGATFAGRRLQIAADFLHVDNARAVVVTNYSQGFTLLAEHPYDPQVCLSLGDFLHSSGHPRSAQLLYTRGQVVFADRPQAAECRRKAQPSLWPLVFSFPQPALPLGLIRRLLEQKSSPLDSLPPACRLILESSGHLPVEVSPETNSAFREAWVSFTDPHPNLTNALQYAIESLTEGFSADAANLAGRIFMLQGQSELALPFLEEARFLDGNHPFAAGNLSLALESVGEHQIAARIADAALANSSTPDSVRIKLAPLRQNRAPETSKQSQ
jgi:tetratricopeptide (TPR) repeat protein